MIKIVKVAGNESCKRTIQAYKKVRTASNFPKYIHITWKELWRLRRPGELKEPSPQHVLKFLHRFAIRKGTIAKKMTR